MTVINSVLIAACAAFLIGCAAPEDRSPANLFVVLNEPPPDIHVLTTSIATLRIKKGCLVLDYGGKQRTAIFSGGFSPIYTQGELSGVSSMSGEKINVGTRAHFVGGYLAHIDSGRLKTKIPESCPNEYIEVQEIGHQ
jgi:hypothetical protein